MNVWEKSFKYVACNYVFGGIMLSKLLKIVFAYLSGCEALAASLLLVLILEG
jgi:hypothetical protein